MKRLLFFNILMLLGLGPFIGFLDSQGAARAQSFEKELLASGSLVPGRIGSLDAGEAAPSPPPGALSRALARDYTGLSSRFLWAGLATIAPNVVLLLFIWRKKVKRKRQPRARRLESAAAAPPGEKPSRGFRARVKGAAPRILAAFCLLFFALLFTPAGGRLAKFSGECLSFAIVLAVVVLLKIQVPAVFAIPILSARWLVRLKKRLKGASHTAPAAKIRPGAFMTGAVLNGLFLVAMAALLLHACVFFKPVSAKAHMARLQDAGAIDRAALGNWRPALAKGDAGENLVRAAGSKYRRSTLSFFIVWVYFLVTDLDFFCSGRRRVRRKRPRPGDDSARKNADAGRRIRSTAPPRTSSASPARTAAGSSLAIGAGKGGLQ